MGLQHSRVPKQRVRAPLVETYRTTHGEVTGLDSPNRTTPFTAYRLGAHVVCPQPTSSTAAGPRSGIVRCTDHHLPKAAFWTTGSAHDPLGCAHRRPIYSRLGFTDAVCSMVKSIAIRVLDWDSTGLGDLALPVCRTL